MVNLERSERAIIIFLIFTLLVGSGVIIYRKTRAPANVRISAFDAHTKKASASVKARININEAGALELSQLKGVGKVLAGRIVEYRQSSGLFVSIEDLKKVKGIGQALFDKIKDDISTE